MELAARIAVHAMRHHEHNYDRIVACVFEDDTVQIYERNLAEIPVAPLPVESAGRVVPWIEPTSFEIAMMAKLKSMLPESAYEHLERSRGMTVSIHFPDLDMQKIWDSIVEDRVQALEQAIRDGTLPTERPPREP